MRSIATTEILPWLQLAAVMIGGKNGAGALHTRIRPFSVGHGRIWWHAAKAVSSKDYLYDIFEF